MPQIELDRATHKRVSLLARAWQLPLTQVVERLVDEFEREPTRGEKTTVDTLPIYAIYRQVRVRAVFHPVTGAVEIVGGPLSGTSYKSPTGAALAVVTHLNPAIHANRNGWNFWRIDATGELLKSARRQ